jgi:DeoR/GlpR family transcriptional regulator of sugar metabolism
MTRLENIVKIVSEKNKIEVNELSELLDVSKVTIRKDLNKLENRGILHREHGYAVLNSENDLNYRLAMNYDVKKMIAKEAVKEVQDNDMVLIESGSTCALLAEEIANERKNVTIITNSNFIATRIRRSDSVNIILLGGEYQKDSQVSTGILTEQAVSNFYCDKIFIGIDGLDKNRGFTSLDLRRAETARVMAKQADEVVILTDATKFTTKGPVGFFRFSEVSRVYTDKMIQSDVVKFLKDQEIELITV